MRRLIRNILRSSLIIGLLFFASAKSYSQATVVLDQLKDACDGLPNGSIRITITNGVPPFAYNIIRTSDFVTIASNVPIGLNAPVTITGLQPDVYFMGVQDGDPSPNYTNSFTIGSILTNLNASVNTAVNNGSCQVPNGSIDIDVSGGTGTYSYEWTGPGGFTASTQDISGLLGGTYDVTISDNASNCTRSLNVVLTDPSPTIQNIVSPGPRTICNGDDLIIDLQTTQPAPVSYELFQNGAGTGNFIPGTGALISYTVLSGAFATGDVFEIQAVDGFCAPVMMNGSVTVTIQTLSVTSSVTDNSRCVAPFNGAIDITVNGTVNPITYTWTGPNGFSSNAEDIIALEPGAYTILAVDDVTACQVTQIINVGDISPMITIGSAVTNNTRCNAPFNGAINITAGGTAGPFTYSWTGPSGFTSIAEDITALLPGTYNITVTDTPTGCTAVAAIDVLDTPPIITIDNTVTNNTRCLAPFNGAIDITPVGTAGPFTYSWTGPSGFTSVTQDISGLLPGTYNITVTDTPTGCTGVAAIDVLDTPPTITIGDAVTNNTRCIAPFNGAIDITAGGTVGPFTYSWTGPSGFTSFTEDISGLVPGTYNVTVTDTPTGCTETAAIDVLDTPPTITVNSAVTNNTRCLAPFNGAIDITPVGGTGPFSYSWTGPGGFTSFTEDISGLTPGSYNVTVTDTPTGCTGTSIISVLDAPVVLTLNNVITNNTRCVAPFNGAIDLTVNGSAGPFTFSWTGPGGFTASTEDINTLVNGAYNVTVTDVTSGCFVLGNFNVGNTTPTLTLNNVVTDNTRCVAPFDGAINLTVNGSAGPFTFSWTGPNGFTASTEDISTLENGAYAVTATDINTGCFVTGNFNVGNATPTLTLGNVVTDNTRCVAPFDGAINLTVNGSAGPFTFSWTGPNGFTAATEDINTLENGAYMVTATDVSSGCFIIGNFNVGNAAPALTLGNVITNNTRCVSPFDGAINLTVNGSAGPFTFSWTGPNGFTAATEDISLLENGAYAVTVTDVNSGCFVNGNFNVGDATPALTLGNAITNNTRCVAPFDGAINLTVNGSAGPFTFSWTGPNGFTASTEDLSLLENGAYTVTVTDVNSGCFVIGNFNVGDATATLSITNIITDNSRCVAPFDGAIDISVAGAPGPFTYTWIGPNGFTASTEDIITLEPGLYTVTVTDPISGCTVAAGLNVGDVAPSISLSNVVTDNARCVLPFNGGIDITVAGSVGPFTYSWTGPNGFVASTEDITTLESGDYDVTVTDTPSGCFATATITVNDITPTLTLGNVITDNTRCALPFNGAIDITPGGSAGPFTYSWTGPNGFTASTEDIAALEPGTYDVTVTDTPSGCTIAATLDVLDAPPVLSVTNTVTDNSRCVAPFNGAINITVAGSAGPFTFSWTGPNGFTASTEDITALEDGTYDVMVTDNTSGCFVTSSIAVGLITPVFSAAGAVTDNTNCVTPFNGAIVVTMTPAVGPYAYAWTGPNGFTSNSKNITSRESGNYQLIITHVNSGCFITENYVIGNNAVAISLALDLTGPNSNCTAPFDGILLITPSGGSGSYNFAWTGPNGFTSNLEDISNIEHGDYTVIVTDNNLVCSATGTYTVVDNTTTVPLATSNIVDNTNCQAPFTGSITVTSGGTPGPYTFSWTGPNGYTGTGANITGLNSGDYIVTITDQTIGCSDQYTLTVGDNTPPITVTEDSSTPNSNCTAPFDGDIRISVAGTPGPFTFSWVGPNGFTSTLEDIAFLEDGLYTVTVTDDLLGCSASLDVTVGDNKPVIAIATINVTPNTMCIAPFDGTITVDASGTPGPFAYTWTGPNGYVGAGATIPNLESGDYDVTATDQILGCSSTATISVPDGTPVITLDDASITPNTLCTAPFDGAIDINTISGTPGPYTFSWTGPNGFTSANQNIGPLEPGDYDVTITDTNLGCSNVFTLNVPDNAPVILATPTITPNTNCNAPFNGAIDIAVAGTAGPFDYSWTGPSGFTSTAEDLTDLEAGTYDVTVTDTNLGCVNSFSFDVPQNATTVSITLNSLVNNTSCTSPFNGEIHITPGGTPGPFTLSWTGPGGFTSASADLTTLAPGAYTVTVTDDILGCQATQVFNVLNNAVGCGGGGTINCSVFTVTINETRPTCANQDDGVFQISVIGGTGGYIITLYDSLRPGLPFTQALPATNAGPISFTTLSPSLTYFYKINDGVNICTLPYSLPVQSTVQASADPASFQDALCFGEPTGSAIINATGSQTGEYYYSVDNGVTWKLFTPGNPINDLPPNGTYNVQVGESMSDPCRAYVSVTINSQLPEITATFAVTPATCNGSDGAVQVTAAGAGGGPYEYSIDNGATFQASNSFINLSGGSYMMVIRDATGCTESFTVNITFPGFINHTVLTSNADCINQGNSGSVTISINVPGIYQVALSQDQFNEPDDADYRNYTGPSVTFNNLPRGTYFVYIKSGGTTCPTRTTPLVINGVYAINFEVDPVCTGNKRSISLINMQFDPSTPYTLHVYKKNTNIEMAGFPLTVASSDPSFVTKSYTLDYDTYTFLQSPDEYQIQIEQFQISAVCLLTSPLIIYEVRPALFATIAETTWSPSDINIGTITIQITAGTGAPDYMTEIKLDSASALTQFYEDSHAVVPIDPDGRYIDLYENVPAGRYEVIVTDADNCFIEVTPPARVLLDTRVIIPNVFTPNDDDLNDTFYIRNLPDSGNQLLITNRWGAEVFVSKDYNRTNFWTGDGVVDGLYFYRLQVDGGEVFTGWVEIMRGVKP